MTTLLNALVFLLPDKFPQHAMPAVIVHVNDDDPETVHLATFPDDPINPVQPVRFVKHAIIPSGGSDPIQDYPCWQETAPDILSDTLTPEEEKAALDAARAAKAGKA